MQNELKHINNINKTNIIPVDKNDFILVNIHSAGEIIIDNDDKIDNTDVHLTFGINKPIEQLAQIQPQTAQTAQTQPQIVQTGQTQHQIAQTQPQIAQTQPQIAQPQNDFTKIILKNRNKPRTSLTISDSTTGLNISNNSEPNLISTPRDYVVNGLKNMFKPKTIDFETYLDINEINVGSDDDDDDNFIDDLRKQNNIELTTSVNIFDKIKSDIVELETVLSSDIKTWDVETIKIIDSWLLKIAKLKIIYNYIADKSNKTSDRINLISTISSFILGLLSAFKLAFKDDIFSIVSDVILMIFNFSIAITAITAKKYLDNSRTDNIKIYLENLNDFEKDLKYNKIYQHINGKDFIRANMQKFNDLTNYKRPEI